MPTRLVVEGHRIEIASAGKILEARASAVDPRPDARERTRRPAVRMSRPTTPGRRRRRMPDRWMPILYFSFAHLCLFAAFATVAVDPRGVGGFFYHPRMLAVVHLITLGWITGSIIGALYVISPLALGAPLPRRGLDGWAFALFVIGVLGLVGHFGADAPSGIESTVVTLLVALLYVAGRVAVALRQSPVPLTVKVHFRLAFVNLLLAGGLALLITLDRLAPLLPGGKLAAVYAHAHLAALGWVLMTVMGAAYRLLPMLLPAAMPHDRPTWITVVLLETGVLGLALGLWASSTAWTVPSALLCLLAIALFVGQVAAMLRRPKPRPPALRRPDIGLLHVGSAVLWLVVSAGLGAAIVLLPEGLWKLEAILVYGALGLVGALAQMVVGVGSRLLPLYAWFRGFAGSDLERLPPSPHELPRRSLQWTVFGLWTAGVPGLAAGLAIDDARLLAASAAALATAVAVSATVAVRAVQRAESEGRPTPATERSATDASH